MLFNLVLIPLEIIVILMIYKVRKNITKLSFNSKGVEDQSKDLYDLDDKFIENHNKQYILPPMKANLFILVIMSISVVIFEEELYDRVVVYGFLIYFFITSIYFILAMLNMNKRKI